MPRPNAGTNIAPRPNNNKAGNAPVNELGRNELRVLIIPDAVNALVAWRLVPLVAEFEFVCAAGASFSAQYTIARQ